MPQPSGLNQMFPEISFRRSEGTSRILLIYSTIPLRAWLAY